jgi:hypothetical protein
VDSAVEEPAVLESIVGAPRVVGQPALRPRGVGSDHDRPSVEPRTDDRPGDGGSDRPRRSGPLVRTGIALLVGLLITVIAVQVGLWWTGSDQPDQIAGQSADQPAGDSSASDARDWFDVVVDLDSARGRALAAADPALLADVYVQASPAAVADRQTIARLADQGLRVVDGRHQVVSVTPVDAAAAQVPDAPSVRLTVVDVLPTHPVVDAAGQQVGVTAGRSEQRRVLVLDATDSGYRISGVEAG